MANILDRKTVDMSVPLTKADAYYFGNLYRPAKMVYTGVETMDNIDRNYVLNLTDFFFSTESNHLWNSTMSGQDVYSRVKEFMERNYQSRVHNRYKYFITAINRQPKRDLPNVNGAFVCWMIKHTDNPLIFVDPIDVLQHDLSKRCHVIRYRDLYTWIKNNLRHEYAPATRLKSHVEMMHQRNYRNFLQNYRMQGVGNSQRQLENVLRNCGFGDRVEYIGVELWPGKKSQNKRQLYDEFSKCMAKVIWSQCDYKAEMKDSGYQYLGNLFCNPDEFSATQMHMMVVFCGLGILDNVSILCYHQRNYTIAKMSDM